MMIKFQINVSTFSLNSVSALKLKISEWDEIGYTTYLADSNAIAKAVKNN